MRKITQQAIKAFTGKYNFKNGNTEVIRIENNTNIKTELYLHNNLIAYEINDNIYISSQGWQTSTTRERLNGILSYYECGRVCIKNFSMYYIDSQKITKPLQNVYFTQIR